MLPVRKAAIVYHFRPTTFTQALKFCTGFRRPPALHFYLPLFVSTDLAEFSVKLFLSINLQASRLEATGRRRILST